MNHDIIFVWKVGIYENLISHLSKLKPPWSPCFALVINGWGRRETDCSINEGFLGSIWNWQLEQQAAAKISEFRWLSRLLKLDDKFDLCMTINVVNWVFQSWILKLWAPLFSAFYLLKHTAQLFNLNFLVVSFLWCSVL